MGMKRQINMCLFMSTGVAYVVGQVLMCLQLNFPSKTWFFGLYLNLGSTLLHSISDDELFFEKGYIYHISSYFGKGKMHLLFMKFCKCVHNCVKTY